MFHKFIIIIIMTCRLLNQIFRRSKTINLYPVLHKIMLNAFPNNNSLLKNTSTSFYTILASNIYKNHYLAKQKNALKYAARLESDINCDPQINNSKDCKTKKKTSKLKYKKIRICNSEDKCKEDMICICMPISKCQIKSKVKLIENDQHKIAELIKKCPSMFCKQQSQPSCSIARKSSKNRKSSPSSYLTKPCNLINYCTPSKQPNTTNNRVSAKKPSPTHCTSSKQPESTGYAPTKKIGSTNSCAHSKKPRSTNIHSPSKPSSPTNTLRKQLRSSNEGVQFKQTGTSDKTQTKHHTKFLN